MTRQCVWAVLTALLALSLVGCSGSGGGSEDVVAEVVDVEADLCSPVCDGKECGPDGCGGYCGSCETGYSCNAQGGCQELPQCELVAKVECDELVQGDTTGRDNELQQYECDGFAGPGPDIAYVFQAQIDDHIKVTLDSGFAALNILVTQSPCAPETCLANGADDIELDVEGGKKYYLVVDGDEGQEGTFSFTIDCQSTCEPQCGFNECGDDGCGGSCGTCPEAAPECIDGFCEVVCEPDCDGVECGPDGCDGFCGTGDALNQGCPEEEPFCNAGTCEGACEPQCDGKECGEDNCGGSCGTCPAGKGCLDGQCVESLVGCEALDGPGCDGCACEACVCAMDEYCCNTSWDSICAGECADPCGFCGDEQPCGDGTCDPGIGENCATCAEDCLCDEGAVCGPDGSCCTPSCDGVVCGDDGCGGSCGQCGEGSVCVEGDCCEQQCDGLECGDDGCGGECGECGVDALCIDGLCCEPQCDGKACGDDGCGGSCGECGDEELCWQDACVPEGDYCVEFVPSTADFGTVAVNTFQSQEVLIKNCGTKDISIIQLAMVPEDVTNMGFDVASLPKTPSADDPIVIAPSDGQTLTVVYLPSEPSETLNGEPVPDTADIVVTAAEAGQSSALTLLGIAIEE